jgi:hypothetical protein
VSPHERSRPLNGAGRASSGQLNPADPGQARAESQPTGPPGADAQGGRLRAVVSHPALRHLVLLAVYLGAGIAATWPLTAYLVQSRLPRTRDVASYVWDLWWTAHQVVHLANPYFTDHMAAPAGIQLAFNTTMPLAGLVMTPVTLAFGPSAAYSLLSIVTPGLLCYVMYRAARLWLNETGAIAAGALFGLSSMLAWQDWYHLNIAVGSLFLPMTLEAVVRLRRRPGLRQSVILGVVLGASILVNQESTVLALILTVLGLLPWLVRHPSVARLRGVGIAAGAAFVIASPQLIAMVQQARTGGASADAGLLALTGKRYGVAITDLFAPAQRVTHFGLDQFAAASSTVNHIGEQMPMFGLLLSVLAVAGLAVRWRRRSAWLLAALWLGCAWLTLGATLYINRWQHVPFAQTWHGVVVSPTMPYTWLMRIPGLSAFREADRFALLGLVGAALLAGSAVDWLRRHAWPVIAVVVALGVLEAGWSGSGLRTMPTTLPALDRPIIADRSGSVVLDVPFGLRGGIPEYGLQFPARALLMATEDGHPRSISYTSWVPARTINGITSHAFYTVLVQAEHAIPMAPNVPCWAGCPLLPDFSAPLTAKVSRNQVISPAQLAAAKRDVHSLNIGWVVVWKGNSVVTRYLAETGFRLAYRADGALVYRPATR